jgi:uncharacterized membrane protein
MTAKHFSMGEAIRVGWEGTKANLLFLIGVMVLTGIIGALPQLVNDESRSASLSFVLSLVSLIVNSLIGLGLTKIALDLADRRTPQFSDLWAPAPLFLNYLVAEILFGLMLAIGLVLFIVPGIIVAIVFGLYSYVIVDRGAGPIEALSRSAALTKGVRMDLFIFGLLIIGINILGALALLVGLLVTVPISMIAGAYVYRQLDAQTAAGAA